MLHPPLSNTLKICYMIWETFTQADNLAALTRSVFTLYPMAVQVGQR